MCDAVGETGLLSVVVFETHVFFLSVVHQALGLVNRSAGGTEVGPLGVRYLVKPC